MKRNQIIKVFLATPLVFLAVYAIGDVHKTNQRLELKQIQLKSVDVELKNLEGQYDEALKEVQAGHQTKQQLDEANLKLQELEKQKQSLEQQLQAKKASSTVYAASVSTGCGSDPHMAFIYQKESGCSPTALNSIGCRGIGQACPGSKLPCGADFACQDAWFRNYAIQRYGSTYAAYVFWTQNHWW